MKRPRLTQYVLEGLQDCVAMAQADLESQAVDEHPMFDKKEVRQMLAAVQWARDMKRYRAYLKGEKTQR